MTIKINVAPQAKEEEDGVECKCTRDTWPLILLMTGFGVAFLVILVCVLSLMTFEGGVPSVILSIYLIFLALLGLEAEFRRIKFLRSIIYNFVIKYFYFLTNYYVRGVYYIFLGSVLLGDKPLNIIAGCVCMGLGVLLIGVHFFVGLPIYTDWQEVQAEAEARIRREAEGVSQAAAGFRSGSTPGAHEHTQTAQQNAQAPAPTNPTYQPASAPAPAGYYNPDSNSVTEREPEPEVPSARRMQANDDDLARNYYKQQQPAPYSPNENVMGSSNPQSPNPQVYGAQSGPASRRNLTDNPFDAADEYQPSRY